MALAASSVLLCANGQYYVGSTENLERRLKEHQNGTGCGFTKAHLPVKLVYKEEYTTIEEAYQRERQLHGWSRKKKEALISGDVDAKNKSRAKSREGVKKPFTLRRWFVDGS